MDAIIIDEPAFWDVEGTSCPVCDVSFQTSEELRRHNLMHQPNAPRFTCDLCTYETVWLDMLVNHKQYVHKDGRKGRPKKNTTCHVCQKVLRNSVELRIHSKVHLSNAPLHSCDFCNYKSKWKEDVIRHIGRYHPLRK